MLAIGKATGSTADDTYGIEYHVIDSAKLQEDIDLANANAAEALELASGATKDTADYLTILKNMILSGIGLTDGSYFDNNGRWDRDPSHVGLYDAIENANFIGEATSFREADDMLDKALKKAVDDLAQLSGATEDLSGTTKGYLERIIAAAGLNEQEPGEYPGHDETHFIKDATSLDNADVLLDAAIWNLSADTYNTIAELSAGTIQLSADTVATIEELSAGTVSGLEFLSGISENIINAAGLEADGTYEHKHDANFIDDATSLFDADVILDTTLAEFSANTVAEFEETNNNLLELSAATVEIQTKEEKIIEAAGLEADGSYPHTHNANFIDEATSLNNADVILDTTLAELSANTMAADQALEEAFNEKIGELSANTMAADQVLQDQIDELDNRKVLGVSAITVETLENGDSKVSLVINEEDDKVLTQNALGLKANVSLVYSREEKKIYLKGKNDTTISTISADDFIKDGMLSAASVFTASEADHEQYPELVVGKTYIKLLFNVDGEEPGRANPVFISAEDLVDIYTVDPELHPELNTFMKIDDYVIKLNVDAENGFASYNYARNISAVTANIISATGLNMGEQGGYPGHDETHYIKNAGSLDQADVLLDEAIWCVSGSNLELSASVVNNENVINNILKGTGLNTQEPGEYPGHDGTHFITSATSLDNADVLLDQAIWGLSGVAGDLSAVTGDLSAVTGEFSATTDERLRNIISGTGLNPDGTYDHQRAHDSHYFTSAYSFYEADEALDTNLWNLSGMVIELSASTLQLSADTYNAIKALSGDVISYVDDSVRSLSGDVISYVDNLVSGFGEDILALSARCNDIEEITAAGLNDLNDRVSVVETHLTGDYITLQGYEPVTGGTSVIDDDDTVNEALGKLQKQVTDIAESAGGNIAELSGAVVSFSAATYDTFGDVYETINNNHNELIVLSGVVEEISAKTSGMLTIKLNGEEQGKYCPSASTTIELHAIQEVTGEDVLLTGYEKATGSGEDELTILPTDNVNDALGKLEKRADDNELVIAAAFNDLNDKIHDLAGSSFDGAEYDSGTKKINFYASGVVVDSIDASDFIKDGMLDNVQVVTIGGEAYLRFTFNTDSGKEDIDIKVSDFAGLYTAGDGIAISAANAISLKLAAKGDTDYLKMDGDGLYLTGVTQIANDLAELSGAVVSKELVIAAAFNDLNDRVLELEDGAEMLDHAVTFNIDGESHGSASTDLSGDQVNINTYKRYETAGSVTGLTLNEFLTIISVSANGTLTIAESGLPTLPAQGVKEAHILIQNMSNDPVVITVDNTDDRLRITGDNKLYIEGNGIGEANALITYDGLAYTIYIIVS